LGSDDGRRRQRRQIGRRREDQVTRRDFGGSGALHGEYRSWPEPATQASRADLATESAPRRVQTNSRHAQQEAAVPFFEYRREQRDDARDGADPNGRWASRVCASKSPGAARSRTHSRSLFPGQVRALLNIARARVRACVCRSPWPAPRPCIRARATRGS